jgi:hypothetical protein
VNRSLAEGVVPVGFNSTKIYPVHKGNGKSRTAQSSYRPVSILPAISKIIETMVRDDLEKFLAATHALPRSQHGFRKGRSCSTALGNAHSEWLKAAKRGDVVGIITMDLSAPFDTIAADKLLPKLE